MGNYDEVTQEEKGLREFLLEAANARFETSEWYEGKEESEVIDEFRDVTKRKVKRDKIVLYLDMEEDRVFLCDDALYFCSNCEDEYEFPTLEFKAEYKDIQDIDYSNGEISLTLSGHSEIISPASDMHEEVKELYSFLLDVMEHLED